MDEFTTLVQTEVTQQTTEWTTGYKYSWYQEEIAPYSLSGAMWKPRDPKSIWKEVIYILDDSTHLRRGAC